MAVLVIGGSGRGAGKTAVGCALIEALPELAWAAVKVSPHSRVLPHPLREELDRDSPKDTGRYLRAGAKRAFLVNGTGEDRIITAREIRRSAAECDSLLVEANQVPWQLLAGMQERGLGVTVLDGRWDKASLMDTAALADALTAGPDVDLATLPASLLRQRLFSLPAGAWMTAEIVELVRSRLLA